MYLDTGDLPRALADYNVALRLDPKCPVCLRARGEVHWRLGDHNSAVTDFTAAIELNPTDADAFAMRSEAYQQLGKEKLAESDRRKALELRLTAKGLRPIPLEADCLRVLPPAKSPITQRYQHGGGRG